MEEVYKFSDKDDSKENQNEPQPPEPTWILEDFNLDIDNNEKEKK